MTSDCCPPTSNGSRHRRSRGASEETTILGRMIGGKRIYKADCKETCLNAPIDLARSHSIINFSEIERFSLIEDSQGPVYGNVIQLVSQALCRIPQIEVDDDRIKRMC